MDSLCHRLGPVAIARVSGAKGHIVRDRRAEKLIVHVLEQHAYLRLDGGELSRWILAQHPHLALGRTQQPEDVVQQRALSGSIGAEDDDPLALQSHEIQPAQTDLGAIRIEVTNAAHPHDFFPRRVEGDGGRVNGRVQYGAGYRVQRCMMRVCLLSRSASFVRNGQQLRFQGRRVEPRIHEGDQGEKDGGDQDEPVR